MEKNILSLDDATALKLASIFTQAQLSANPLDTDLVPELTIALREAFLPDGATDFTSPSEGDLARNALLLLSEHPEHGPAIRSMVSGPQPEQLLGVVETVTAVVIGLVVLRTYVKIERDKSGKFSFKIEHKPANDILMKTLIEKLSLLQNK